MLVIGFPITGHEHWVQLRPPEGMMTNYSRAAATAHAKTCVTLEKLDTTDSCSFFGRTSGFEDVEVQASMQCLRADGAIP